MPEPVLTVTGLRKFFTVTRGFPRARTVTVRALDGISFRVRDGEAFGLVGESGCGKSTAGRAVLRLVEPDAGEIVFKGENVIAASKARLRELRRKLQIIFQDPYASLNPRRRIGKALIEPMRVHGIADEPVSALDVSIQAQILLLLQRLQERRKLAFIFISHDLGVVRYFCQSMAVMYLGRIVETGPIPAIFKEPLHPYTKMLRDASPVPDPRVKVAMLRIEGEVPSAVNPPAGCHFHTRCPHVMPICRTTYPQWRQIDGERGVACHLHST